MTDPISDMLTRIRNAQAVKRPVVYIPYSQLKFNIAKLLLKQNLIKNVTKRGRKIQRTLEIEILYDSKSKPVIRGLRRISKPGRRVYKKVEESFGSKNSLGTVIISTSKGLMTKKEAVKKNIGGEIMFELW